MSRQREQITTEELDALGHAYDQCAHSPTRTRLQAVRLYGQGYAVEEICVIVRCSRSILMKWWRLYRQSGVEGLYDQRKGGNRARLKAEQIAELRETLHAYTPEQLLGPACATPHGKYWTLDDLATLVERRYGVRYRSLTSYRNLMKRCRMSYQRSQKVYRSRSQSQVSAFEEELEKNW